MLDDKLKELIVKFEDAVFEDKIPNIDRIVNQIKQAFADEWGEPGSINTINGVQRVFGKPEYMTGQDWFAQFDKQFRGEAFAFKTKEGQRIIIQVTNAAYSAAKKASGVE